MCKLYSVGVPELPHTLKLTDVSLVIKILTEEPDRDGDVRSGLIILY